jgi:hypothetical protein
MLSLMEAHNTRLFRGMKKSGAGLPLCGVQSEMLGARVPQDVQPDEQGLVHPLFGGISVAPDDPRHLPPHRRPAALGGTSKHSVFELALLCLPKSLQFRRDPQKPLRHGFVEPSQSVALDVYQSELALTASLWKEMAL